MIIKYSTKTQDIRNPERVIYWFEIKLPTQAWTSICIGFDSNKQFTCGSKTFFELDSQTRDEIVANTQPMVDKVVE